MREILARYDLTALAARLRQDQRHRRFSGLVEKAVSVASAHQDLLDAQACLALLNELTTEARLSRGWAKRKTSCAAGALFSQSIILYARATTTKSENRRQWFGREKLSAEQQEVHDLVMTLRNDTIAHFGFGNALSSGPLVKEALVLLVTKERQGPVFYASRIQNKSALAGQLLDLVEALVSATHVRALELMNAAADALREACDLDPSLQDIVSSFEFDSEAFLPDPKMEEPLFAGMRLNKYSQSHHGASADLRPERMIKR